jgi:uncharacterized protein involved in exopolysaccharide biosynthesis
MDLQETGRRIFMRHWRMILLFVVAALAVSDLVSSMHGVTYTANARLALDMPDPRSQAESQVIADTGNALATSPAQVATALSDAHIKGRNAADVAANEVTTTSLGTSGVLELSVSDRDPVIATKIANALANDVINVRDDIANGTSQKELASLDQRIAALNLQVGHLDARVESLNEQAATAANPTAANTLRTQRDELTATRNTLAAQVATLQSERDKLDSVNAAQPQGALISSATPPTVADPTGRPSKMVLGFLLGLILGVGTAALVETLRPTLAGGYAVARELQLPLLRQLSGAPDEPVGLDEAAQIAERLRLAAETAHVRRVCLVAAGEDVDVAPLARVLDETLRASAGVAEPEHEFAAAAALPHGSSGVPHAVGGPSAVHPRIRVVPADFRGAPISNGGGTALAMVSSAALSKDELDDASLLLRVSPVPTLGVIAYGRRAKRRRAIRTGFSKA